MSKVDSLVKKYCSAGVPYVSLNDIAEIANRGVNKVDSPGETEVHLLNYMDVYRSREITKSSVTAITTASANQISQCDLRVGDILITPTSETRDDLAHASVVVTDLPTTVYSYHLTRLRILDHRIVEPKFLALQFRSAHLQSQIIAASNGITRFGLTKPKWEALKIQLPPIEVQRVIVSILEKFTYLQAELEAELEARKKQYSHYRDLYFKNDLITGSVTQLEDCLEKVGRINWKANPDLELDYIDLSSVDRESRSIQIVSKVNGSNAPSRAQQLVRTSDVLFGTTRPTLNRLCLVPTEYDGQVASTGFCILRAKPAVILPGYLFHLLNSASFQSFVSEKQEGASYPSIADSVVKSFKFKLPGLEEQLKVSDRLNKLLQLSIDPECGIYTEISLRRQQFEYYLDKLLTFKQFEVV